MPPARHERKRTLKRTKPTTVAYDAHHKALRKRWRPRVAAGTVNCRRCGERIESGEPWDLGHDDDDRSLPPAPEHARCNRATLTHAKQQAAASPQPSRWS